MTCHKLLELVDSAGEAQIASETKPVESSPTARRYAVNLGARIDASATRPPGFGHAIVVNGYHLFDQRLVGFTNERNPTIASPKPMPVRDRHARGAILDPWRRLVRTLHRGFVGI